MAAILAPSAPGAANPVVHSATGSGHQDDVDASTGDFSVQDNGEPGAGVDKFSGVPPNPLARDCDDTDFGAPAPARVAPTRTVERGEIQVR